MVKRVGCGILALASIFVSLLSVVPPVQVAAAGETYRWKDYNTLEVFGGDVQNTTEFKLVQGSNPQKFSAVGYPEHEKGCKLQMTIFVVDNNSVRLEVVKIGEGGGTGIRPEGAVFCSDDIEDCTLGIFNCHLRFEGVAEGYDGKTVDTSGNRPGEGNQSEDELQKRVSVVINSPNPNSSSEETIHIEIRDSQNRVVAQQDPHKQAALGNTDPNNPLYVDPLFQPVNYIADFQLDPGDYTVCASIVISDCKAFKKVRFEPLILEYGDASNERAINVNITVGYIGGPQNMTVGPLEVTMRKPDGSTISIQTNQREHRMTEEEEQANGLIEVEYKFGLQGVFNGVEPGIYIICVVGLAECKEVTKVARENAVVSFIIDWNTFNYNEEHEKECVDKYEVMGVQAVTFLVCSVIDTATFAVGALDSAINQMLTVDVEEVFADDERSNAFHVAWNSFRIFALGLIVIAALIMVTAQAFGSRMVDAYTIKRIMPRLLFAAVFIALSWDILEFLTQLSNDAGLGIRSLIYAPFRELDTGGDIGGGSIYALTLIGTGAALALGWLGLLSFVLTGLLASLVAIAVLVFRKALILLLVMMAPFAIAAYVLPNTQKLWDTWKTTFIGVLIVFPIISSFIAIGRVFSITAFQSPGNATINQLVALIAYFAPYFLISLAFRMAGGIVATVGGMVNDRTKGAFDRLKNYRSQQISQNMTRMREGQRFSNTNPLARAFNATTRGLGTGVSGRFGLGGRGRAARDQTVRTAAHDLMKSQAFQGISEDDDTLAAATYDSAGQAFNELSTRWGDAARARRAVQAVQSAGLKFGAPLKVAAAQQLVEIGTGYENMEEMVDTLARASDGNDHTANYLARYAGTTAKQQGRHDLAPGQGNLTAAVRRTAGIDPGGPLTAAEFRGHGGLYDAAWRSADPITLARDRVGAYGNFVNHFTEQLETARQAYVTAQAAGNTAAMQVALEQGQDAETALYEQEQSGMYMPGENVAVLEQATARAHAGRQWLDSMTRVGAPVQQVVSRDPTNPNNLIYTSTAPTYQAEARARARVTPRRPTDDLNP